MDIVNEVFQASSIIIMNDYPKKISFPNFVDLFFFFVQSWSNCLAFRL